MILPILEAHIKHVKRRLNRDFTRLVITFGHPTTKEKLGKITFRIRSDELFIKDFDIEKKYQGQGWGTHIINNLVKVMAKNRELPIRLISVEEAIKFWEKLGFECLGEPVCIVEMQYVSE